MTYEPHCDDQTMASICPNVDHWDQQNSVPAATCYVCHSGLPQHKYPDFLRLRKIGKQNDVISVMSLIFTGTDTYS